MILMSCFSLWLLAALQIHLSLSLLQSTQLHSIFGRPIKHCVVRMIDENAEYDENWPTRTTPRRSIWTKQLDDRMKRAVQEGLPSWREIAKVVGANMTERQCRNRWSKYASPSNLGFKDLGNWSEFELSRLIELARLIKIQSHWSVNSKSMTKERINWIEISKHLNRTHVECRSKYTNVLKKLRREGKLLAARNTTIIDDRMQPEMHTVKESGRRGIWAKIWNSVFGR